MIIKMTTSATVNLKVDVPDYILHIERNKKETG